MSGPSIDPGVACFVSSACRGSCCSAPADSAEATKLRKLIKGSPREAALLGGSDPTVRAQVDSWVYSAGGKGLGEADLAGLNVLLARRSFVCDTPNMTLADVVAYFAVARLLQQKESQARRESCRQLANMARWFDQCAYEMRAMAPACDTLPQLGTQAAFATVLFPVGCAAGGAGFGSGFASPMTGAEKKKEKGVGKVVNGTEKNPGGPKKGAAEEKAKPQAQKSEKGKKEGKGDSGSGKAAAAAATATPAGNEGDPDVSNLDIRVGIITKVWPHPDSDKLFCEEIDIGEEKPRQICSGLRAFYKQEEMQGATVVVMANLKPRKMAGFKSEGMVVCASNTEHTEVKLLIPPEGAKPGDKFVFEGYKGEPLSSSQVDKKKVLDKCMPLFRTDDKGIACFDKSPFAVEGKGQCAPTLPNSKVG